METITFLDKNPTDGESSSQYPMKMGEPHLYRQSLRLFLGSLALLLLIQSSLNFALNPAGLFRPSGLLLNSIRNSDTYLKLEALDDFLERTSGHEITIALGSSRILLMSFSSEGESDSHFFNAATSGGQPEDILAFTRHILDQPHVQVGRVYINADPFLLSRNTEYGGRLEGVYALSQEISPEEGHVEHLSTIFTSLLSNDWLQAIREHRRSGALSPIYFDAQSGIRDESAVFAPQLANAGSRESLLDQHVDRVLASISSTAFSEKRADNLEAAVSLLTDHGANVVLIFMPHEARLWASLMADPAFHEQIVQTRHLLESLAQDPRVTFCDFADPETLGLGSSDYWWDGVHYTTEAAEVIDEGVQTCVART